MSPTITSPRERFTETVTELLGAREDLALVYAEISGQYVTEAARLHPDRVINVGIREQLLVSTGGGLALGGVRPVVHTFASFLVERAFEQIKLDFAHQGTAGVLVSTGGSFDMAPLGRTHQSPGDVALAATVPGLQVHAPGGAEETERVLRDVIADDGLHYVRLSEQVDATPRPADGAVHRVREGRDDVVILALGTVLDQVLAAAEELDASVLTTTRVRPLDAHTLREGVGEAGDIVVVEPWLEGTSLGSVAELLADRPRRYLGIGTAHQELRRYGTALEHERAHGLDAAGIVRRVEAWRAQTV